MNFKPNFNHKVNGKIIIALIILAIVVFGVWQAGIKLGEFLHNTCNVQDQNQVQINSKK